jgi:divalent metal cation (Fe/Co/Zn/Cd) transporter
MLGFRLPWLDPVIALIVAANIVWSVGRIVYKSVSGLMDAAMPAEERDTLQKVLTAYMQNGVTCHAIRLWRQFYRTVIHFIGTAWVANRRSP